MKSVHITTEAGKWIEVEVDSGSQNWCARAELVTPMDGTPIVRFGMSLNAMTIGRLLTEEEMRGLIETVRFAVFNQVG